MSAGQPAVVTVLQRSRAKGTERLVLAAVAAHAYPDGTGAWPSLRTIALHAAGSDDDGEPRVSERTVQRAFRALEKLGELRVHVKAGPHGTNAYEVLLCAPAPDAQVSGSEVAEVGHPDVQASGSAAQPDAQVSGMSGASRDNPTSGAPQPDIPGRQPDILGRQPDVQVSAKPSVEPSAEPSVEPPPAPAPTGEADGDRLASVLTRRGIDPDDARVVDALAAHGTRHVARAALLCDAFDEGDPVAALLGGLAFEARRDAGASHEEAETAGIAAAADAARQPIAQGARA